MLRWSRSARVLVAVVVGAAVVVGLALFQPWRLFVNETVDDALPPVATTLAPESTPTTESTSATRSTGPVSATPQARPSKKPEPTAKVLATATLISHEHPTSGTVKIIRQPDGQRILRFEGLRTTSGPDLRVWLSSGPVIEGVRGWRVFADHDHLELGELKGNRGNQNYAIPKGADLDELTSVSIWCRRFSVSFGAAELTSGR